MAQLTVGLDLGNQSLTRVRLKSSFRSVEVLDCKSVPIPQDDRPYPERLAEALSRLDGHSSPSDLVATALPGDVITVRTLQLPFSDNKRIQQTVGFELESQIPFSLDDVVFDYMRLMRSPQGSRLLVAVCRIEQMQRWLDAFRAGGLDPRLVGADCLAYSSLADYLPRPAAVTESSEPEIAPGEDEEPQADAESNGGRVALLDIGHRLTSVCVLGPEGVEFGRTLSGGGADATRRLAQAFGVDVEEAEAGKRRGVFIETAELPAHDQEAAKISGALRASTDILVRELRQTLTSHRTLARSPVDKIWLCGGGANVRNLDAYLADALQLEVERLRPEHLALEGIEKLAHAEAGSGSAGWVKALGLALHAHQGGRRGWLNLRRGPFAFKGDFTAWRGKLLQVVAALLVLGLLAVGNALVHYFSLRSTEKSLDARIRETSQAILGKSYDNVDKALAIIDEKISMEELSLPRSTALDSLQDVHARIPEELTVRLKDVNISPTRIRIEGFTDTFDSVEKIKAALEKNECYTEVRTGKTRKTRDDDEVEFELTIASSC